MCRILTFEELKKRNFSQMDEALGPVNKYYAGLKLGHSPDANEALIHYANNGGPEDWCRRNQKSQPQQ